MKNGTHTILMYVKILGKVNISFLLNFIFSPSVKLVLQSSIAYFYLFVNILIIIILNFLNYYIYFYNRF